MYKAEKIRIYDSKGIHKSNNIQNFSYIRWSMCAQRCNSNLKINVDVVPMYQ